MGFFIRKSFSFGPLRFNLSKSGVGLSAGVTGLRAGVKPNGQTYVAGGRGGLYFRENTGKLGAPVQSQGAYTVTGHATRKGTGQPAGGVALRLRMPDQPSVNRPLITDPYGRFEVSGLPPGDFIVSGDTRLLQTINVVIDSAGAGGPDITRGLLLWFWVAVGMVVVIALALMIDSARSKAPIPTPIQAVSAPAHSPLPTSVPRVSAMTAAPVAAALEKSALYVDPTPIPAGTITMHGKSVTVRKHY